MAAWLLDASLASVGEAYARFLLPSFHHVWRDEILTRLAPELGHRVVDVACGTGAVALRAAERVGPGGRSVGVDASEAMLATARRSTPSALAPRVTWRLGDAHRLPFPDRWAHSVACPHGLMFFDSPRRALQEVWRVLRPGGRAVATVWGRRDRVPHEAAMAEAFTEVLGRQPPFFEELLSLGEPGAMERLLAKARLPGARIRLERVTRTAAFATREIYWRGMVHGRPLAALVGTLPRGDVARIRHAACARLAPYAAGRGFRSPMEGVIVTLTKPRGEPHPR